MSRISESVNSMRSLHEGYPMPLDDDLIAGLVDTASDLIVRHSRLIPTDARHRPIGIGQIPAAVFPYKDIRGKRKNATLAIQFEVPGQGNIPDMFANSILAALPDRELEAFQDAGLVLSAYWDSGMEEMAVKVNGAFSPRGLVERIQSGQFSKEFWKNLRHESVHRRDVLPTKLSIEKYGSLLNIPEKEKKRLVKQHTEYSQTYPNPLSELKAYGVELADQVIELSRGTPYTGGSIVNYVMSLMKRSSTWKELTAPDRLSADALEMLRAREEQGATVTHKLTPASKNYLYKMVFLVLNKAGVFDQAQDTRLRSEKSGARTRSEPWKEQRLADRQAKKKAWRDRQLAGGTPTPQEYDTRRTTRKASKAFRAKEKLRATAVQQKEAERQEQIKAAAQAEPYNKYGDLEFD